VIVHDAVKRLVEGIGGTSAAPGDYCKIQNFVVNFINGETIHAPPPAHDVSIV
jgi:hypothetical protein